MIKKITLISIFALFTAIPLVGFAQQALSPPAITTVSSDITNEEIFYAGGKTASPKVDVVVHLQNQDNGETQTFTITSNQNGEWFYRHPTFLSPGSYLIWAQSMIGDNESPPSPQVEMVVEKTAFQLGSSRISLSGLYFALTIILFVLALGLLIFIIYHFHHANKRNKEYIKELEELEDAVEKGFITIKRDIERELKSLDKGSDLSEKQKDRKDELLNDLREVREHIGKELIDLEKFQDLR